MVLLVLLYPQTCGNNHCVQRRPRGISIEYVQRNVSTAREKSIGKSQKSILPVPRVLYPLLRTIINTGKRMCTLS